jgi:outer membrane protein OmpA-like peptidoglycan-associated protein
LAERRATAVVDALKKLGIDDSRITSSSKGDTEQPFDISELNRVSICVAK